MAEQVVVYERDDRVYTVSEVGRLRVFRVGADGRLRKVQGDD